MTRPPRGFALALAATAAAAALVLVAPPRAAEAGTYGDRLVSEGNEFFRTGNYFRASESYRCSVLEEPADGMKKLYFGHSLFALGNYVYAADSFRRGIRYLGYPDDLSIDIVSLFPSRLAYERSLRDARRYSSYYPSDPHALTVIAYASLFGGDRAEAAAACKKLLAANARDAFAAYLMRRIELGAGAGARPEASRPIVASAAAAPDLSALAPPRVAPEGGIVLRRPAPAPVRSRVAAEPEKVAAPPTPPVELPPGERSGPITTLSHEEPRPALVK